MITIIPASQRHFADHGWLKTYWLFSFGDYYEPKNLHHGVLRVFNDDIVDAKQGFGMHPHRDMEIVTIMLKGEISHKDSMGNATKIKRGEVQRMSAGTGIYHSEMNDGDEPLHLYQIWVIPNRQGITPDYEQKAFDPSAAKNSLLPIVSPDKIENALFINQDASFYLSDLDAGKTIHYQTKAQRKLFIYVSSGALQVNGQTLLKNDQARISDEEELNITATENAEFILIDCTPH